MLAFVSWKHWIKKSDHSDCPESLSLDNDFRHSGVNDDALRVSIKTCHSPQANWTPRLPFNLQFFLSLSVSCWHMQPWSHILVVAPHSERICTTKQVVQNLFPPAESDEATDVNSSNSDDVISLEPVAKSPSANKKAKAACRLMTQRSTSYLRASLAWLVCVLYMNNFPLTLLKKHIGGNQHHHIYFQETKNFLCWWYQQHILPSLRIKCWTRGFKHCHEALLKPSVLMSVMVVRLREKNKQGM